MQGSIAFQLNVLNLTNGIKRVANNINAAARRETSVSCNMLKIAVIPTIKPTN
jgi:hypothetical protein